MKDEPNRAPAKAAIAPGQRPGAVAHGEKRRNPPGEYPKIVAREFNRLSSSRETLLPVTDRVWQSRNRLASYQKGASHVGAKNHKRAAIALHEFSAGLMELRDELDRAGWDIEARWVHHAASELNMAARFAWIRGGE